MFLYMCRKMFLPWLGKRKVSMYNPISSEFFDQLMVTMERKIPSTIEYYKNIDGFEFLVLDTEEKIRLSWVVTFNGKRHRAD